MHAVREKFITTLRDIRLKFINGNRQFRKRALVPLPYWIASLITGLVAVFYARLFSLGEELNKYIFRLHSWLLLLVTPVCFLLAWWLVKRFAKFARGSGIPQVMAAIEFATPRFNHRVDRLLSMKVLAVKVASSLLMVIAGAAIGREGPTIQIAGCIFRKVNQLIPKSWPRVSKKNMIMTGAAAGLAAAFNTPLGGIVFAVEELTRTHINYFKIAILSAVIIAGLTAQALLGPYLYLGFPNVSKLSPYIFFAVIAASVVAGLLGGLMSKWIVKILKWKAGFKKSSSEIAYVVGCAIVLAGIAIFLNDSILGSGKEQMTGLLFTTDKYGGWLAPVLRIVGPVLSFTTGAAGGVFAPSLSAGACIGSWCAQLFELSNTNSNLLILAGMVAFLTGVTRSPFTSAILVLEMTDRHSVIFHLMLAGIVAVLVASIVDRRSLYDHLKHQYMDELEHDDLPPGKATNIERQTGTNV